MKLLLPVLVALVLVAAGLRPERAEAQVLVLGDSVLTWNEWTADGSAPEVVQLRYGRRVVNNAVPGSGLLKGGNRGPSVPEQYRAGNWDAVVINGGANDLLSFCGCAACDEVVDRLVSSNGATGAYPDLMARIDAPIILIGYYGPVRGGSSDYNICADETVELSRRLRQIAERRPDIIFISLREAFGGARKFYDSDNTHPSVEGTALIARLIAEALDTVDPR